jgi:hypothetical protein
MDTFTVTDFTECMVLGICLAALIFYPLAGLLMVEKAFKQI